jgi:hypothetical protein
LDLKEQLIDPIRKFMGGPQKDIYTQARIFIQSQEPNFTYVKGETASSIRSALNDPACFKGNRIQQMKNDLDALQQEVDKKVEEIREQAVGKLKTMQKRMQAMDEYKKLPDVRMAELDAPYQELIDHIKRQDLIAVINDRLRYFEEQGYQKLLTRIIDLTAPKVVSGAAASGSSEEDNDEHTKEPRPKYIASRNISVAFDKALLTDEGDVDRYLESMRKALLEEIRKGNRIQI